MALGLVLPEGFGGGRLEGADSAAEEERAVLPGQLGCLACSALLCCCAPLLFGLPAWQGGSTRSVLSAPVHPARCSAPMVINGASLPDSLLEALGLQAGAGGGFQIKLVRSGALTSHHRLIVLRGGVALRCCTICVHYKGWTASPCPARLPAELQPCIDSCPWAPACRAWRQVHCHR